MTHTERNIARLCFKVALLLLLPMCGMSWALIGQGNMLYIAITITAICIAAAFGAETLASSTEEDIARFKLKLAEDRNRRALYLAKQDEKLRNMHRITTVLENQNHDIRAELITTLVRVRKTQSTEQE